MELLTPEPIYSVQFNPLIVRVRGFLVNSFGKTVRARQQNFAIALVNGTDRIDSEVLTYNDETETLILLLPEVVQVELGTIVVQISLASGANFVTTISFIPVYGGEHTYYINIDF